MKQEPMRLSTPARDVADLDLHAAVDEGRDRCVALGDKQQDVGVEFGLPVVVRAIDPDEFVVALGDCPVSLAAERPIMHLVRWAQLQIDERAEVIGNDFLQGIVILLKIFHGGHPARSILVERQRDHQGGEARAKFQHFLGSGLPDVGIEQPIVIIIGTGGRAVLADELCQGRVAQHLAAREKLREIPEFQETHAVEAFVIAYVRKP